MQTCLARALTVCLLSVAALRAAPAAAQHTLFNVPTGVPTESGVVFAQEQVTLGRKTGSSGSTLDVGLGHGFELGLNVMSLSMYGVSAPTASSAAGVSMMANAQKSFALDEKGRLNLALGTQVGARSTASGYRVGDFAWAIGSAALDARGSSVFVGGYHANRTCAGAGVPVGALVGIELVLIPARLALQVDFVSGAREISAGVAGFMVELPGEWQLALGVQVPTPRSESMLGLVVELTQKGIPIGRGRNHPDTQLAARAASRM